MAQDENGNSSMERLRTGFTALSARVRVGSAAAGKTLSEQMTVVGGRVKELFATPTAADRLVDDATAESLVAPDWEKSLQICDLVNAERMPSSDVVKAIKRRILTKNAHVQILSLTLLETAVKNCVRMFAEVSSEKVLDEMVRIIDDYTAVQEVQDKCLKMIEAWGEAAEDLRYLPVFEETYKSLKSRGVRFPGRDNESLAPIFTPAATHAVAPPRVRNAPPGAAEAVAPAGGLGAGFVVAEEPTEVLGIARNCVELLSTVLTSAPPEEAIKDDLVGTLVAQCHDSRSKVQRVVETAGDNETLMFEALAVLDEVDAVLTKHRELKKSVASSGDAPATLPRNNPTDASPLPEGPAVVPLTSQDDDDSTNAAETDSLVRHRATAPTAPARGGAGGGTDAEAMAHLDQVIFGGEKDKDKKDDDMIVF
eukprot:TRINITY_DN19112_c0_g1_i1.p1 TRINITY_DN19112_c0_g1~~TRINITY_DN19112_c0_g1_i1.p1  ORF type:complete len:457 (+),score=86.63 TRINITY_DN19112_c0_g1_i1:101-1372(+)